MTDQLTATQNKLLDVLSDGKAHKRGDLMSCLWDERGKKSNLAAHMTALRRVLRPIGQDIMADRMDQSYRLVSYIDAPCRCKETES